MADNSSQPGTSTGSGNIINYVSGCNIGNFNQHNNISSTSSAKIEIDYCPAPVTTFLGRSEELGTLKTLLTEHQMVALVGMGGLGKTQLSRKYVQVNKADYQYRYWLESETPEKLENSFKELANMLDIKSVNVNKVVNDVYKKIEAVPTILVFDNVEKPADVYAYLPTRVDLPPGVTIHVLVTSRWADWTCDAQIECYKLPPMDISTSLQIFQRKFGETYIDTMLDEWEELAELLGYLPLALQVAASYICKRNKHNSDLRTVLADYMKQLEEGAAGLLNDPLTEYGNRSIYTSMMLTLKQLENKADSVSNVQNEVQWKFAVTIISTVAYIDPDFIEKNYLLKLVDNPENICKLDEALEILTEYSLLNQRVDWRKATIYSVHRIIQTSIRHNQTLMGTADKYYIWALKCVFTKGYILQEVLQYANERASAVAAFYKDNPSPTILNFLVRNNAIRAMEAILKLISINQSQIAIKEQDLLYHAVVSGDLSMVQLLCKHGADINQVCHKGLCDGPPLHHALASENVDIATWLLENGAAPSVRNRTGRNALHVAANNGNHKLIPTIIKTDRAVVNETDNDGHIPLHHIYYSNNKEDILSTTCVLVESGADITAVDCNGNTVLHSASSNACAAAVSLILQLNKYLINFENKIGETALHVIPYDDIDIDDEHILSTMRVLIENGVDFSKVDSRGNTVLYYAAWGACVAAVSLILQVNKDLINIVNEDGETALHVIGNFFDFEFKFLSEEYRKELFARIKETAQVLIMNGLSLDTRDKKGCTPLDTVLRAFKDILLNVAEESNNQLMESPVKR